MRIAYAAAKLDNCGLNLMPRARQDLLIADCGMWIADFRKS